MVSIIVEFVFVVVSLYIHWLSRLMMVFILFFLYIWVFIWFLFFYTLRVFFISVWRSCSFVGGFYFSFRAVAVVALM